ncbi:MAG TPA: AsmA family protein, partial [Myxococcota bacterium]|nr:AsmA family protein [Myxococcota bacterium]
LIALGAVFALLLIAVAVALALFDTEKLRGPLQTQASAALGRDVTLGKIALGLFPLPAVKIDDVRIAGPKPSDPPLADVAEIRLRVALLPLIAKKVVLRALEIDKPRIDIPFDKDGKPILPKVGGAAAAPTAKSGAGKSEAAKPETAKEPGAAEPAGLALAVDRIAIHDADVTAGPWKVEHANIEGQLSLDGMGSFKYSLNLPGLAALRNGELELAKLMSGAPQVDARGEFATDLADVRKRFALAQDITGKASGEYAVGLSGSEIRSASASLDVPDIGVRSGNLVVAGPATGHAVLGESFSFDLTEARVEQTGLFAKPKHTTLSVTGKLGKDPSLAALREALVKIGANELPLTLALAKQPMRVHVGKTSLDLGKLRELLPPDKPPLAGRVNVDGFDVQLQPLRVDGGATLAGVETNFAHGPITLNGPLRGKGESVALENGTVLVGGQKIGLSASYTLESGAIRASYDASRAEVGKLVDALSGRKQLDGTLDSNGQFETRSSDFQTIAGSGKFAIHPGRIQGFSLGKQVMGSLAAFGIGGKNKDLSKYESEEFDHLSADYTIADRRLHTENLELAYQEATAYLHGSVGLFDRTLDLAGKVVISKSADAALASTGGGKGKERVIPIAHIGGTWDSPQLQLDPKSVAAIGSVYLSDPKTKKKLDKALGPGGGDAVQSVIDGLLGGGGSKKKEQ